MDSRGIEVTMPYIFSDPNVTTWSYGVTVIGKVAKPGSKHMVMGNGREGLKFTVLSPSGIPFDKQVNPLHKYDQIYFRCLWLDPDMLLYPSDVVRVTGIITRLGEDIGLMVNRCECLARFFKKGKKVG
jgi:hypothetical protein